MTFKISTQTQDAHVYPDNSLNPTPILQCIKTFKKMFCLDYCHYAQGSNYAKNFDSALSKMSALPTPLLHPHCIE